jgi:glycosyltransferase involved in cell wall biosynthesis
MPTDRYEVKYDLHLIGSLKYGFKNLFPGCYGAVKQKQFFKLLAIRGKKLRIIVPSCHTKYALLSYFPHLDSREIQVLYSPKKQHQNEAAPDQGEELLTRFSVEPREFFLILSANRWIKNAYRAVEALDEIYTQWPQLEKRTLVLGAPKGNEPAWRLKNRDKFVWANYVSDQELEALYRTAYVLLYPTLNEGFGYPPLECMRYGTPVVSSSITSTTEVCGDAVLYVNPFSIGEMKNRFLMMLFEPGVWEEYHERGKKRAQYIGHKQEEMLNQLCRTILE